ncbi:Retrovirus-related Pol polyprotein from type-1 retrotransposable element R1 3 [Eumeta japonica]|uniref:Retrovirus-related Pol polyprotein from type-1 retrotransposable element R1 3 n=1 Tax=Eumeta variegata TaxID=151549 RepID=A0A4C1YFF4_EUMVA|nr:Retrovirus-related Pol polyprotein from type-1 retrotransposable element R1 3 [Eumeta japonica]
MPESGKPCDSRAPHRRRQRTDMVSAVVRERVIRAASLEEWQERYAEGGTGEITKCFFPEWNKRTGPPKTEMTSHLAQTLTGHGGFSVPTTGSSGKRKTGRIFYQTDSGLVLSPNESATLLAETFFPDDQSILTIRITRSVSSSKGPALMGSRRTYARLRSSRDLGVFLAMAAKCLELGYFPAWKVAAIKSRDRVRERRGLDSQTVDRLAVVGPQIYTDGSRIEGKVGAALTEWRDGRRLGTGATSRSLLHGLSGGDGRAAKSDTEGEEWRNISGIVAEGRAVRLFWVRAHAGIAGNERANELARRAALTKKTAADYDQFPLSYAKKVIRAASLEEWQQRYAEGSTGEVTKCFFPRVEQAYRVLRDIDMTSQVAQTLTGHGGFAQYLFRFKLRDAPYCACDPAKIQDVLHVLEDCDMFLRERVALEMELGVRISRRRFPEILGDAHSREKFVKYCEDIVNRCNRINRSSK